jgi:hypothetical protein
LDKVVETLKTSALDLVTVSVRLYAPRAVLLPEYSQVSPNLLGKYWLSHKDTGVGEALGKTTLVEVGVWL